MIKFLKDWTLPLAMLLGGILFPIEHTHSLAHYGHAVSHIQQAIN